MIVKILIGLAILAAVLVVIVAMQPSDFRVARTATISVPAAVVFAEVNNLPKWQAWSPFVKLDPDMKVTYSGPESGVGAISSWDGPKAGAGSMTIVESRPDELIKFRLDFTKPFPGTSPAEFVFVSKGDATEVTWEMTGKNNFICKAMGLIMSPDKMLGGEFEKGLADLKKISESKK